MIGDAQSLDNAAADSHGFIGVDGHGHPHERVERFAHAGIQKRVVEIVRGVILDEEFQAQQAILFGSGAAQGARNQGWSALPHVAENLLVRQRLAPKLRKSRVDRKGQVELGIDQRAVQIENQCANFREAGDLVPQ